MGTEHSLVPEIETDRAIAIELRPSKVGQLAQIQMTLIATVDPRHMARHHPGIGRIRRFADQRQPHPRHRVHPPHPQGDRMAMPPAQEH